MKHLILGAIAGDIIGSVFEHDSTKFTEFPLFQPGSRFTDDTVLTVALMDAILNDEDYLKYVLQYGRRYPHAGYGGFFRKWIFFSDPQPYHSYGNGSAMRASPIGWAFDSEEAVLQQAAASAAISHDHPEGIKGAQAAALAVYLARSGTSKEVIREKVEALGYDLRHSYDEIQPGYTWDVTCQGTVPAALIAFLDSTGVEDCIRKAIALGGDADTLAAIAGAIAEPFYGGVPPRIAGQAIKYLPTEMLRVVERFSIRVDR